MFQSPAYLTPKGKKNALINCFVGGHDLICSCKNPAYHCLEILASTLGPQLKEEEKNQIKQCLGTTETTTTGVEEDGLGFGDLEKLFDADFTEDNDG